MRTTKPQPCCWVEPILVTAAMNPDAATHHHTGCGWPCCEKGTSDIPMEKRSACGGVMACCKCLRDAGLTHSYLP